MKPHDPNHPYVRRLVGCGHGVLFKDYCKDCVIVGLLSQRDTAKKTLERTERLLRELGEEVR